MSRVFRLLNLDREGALVMAPSICWFRVPLILGFSGIRVWLVGSPGLPVLSNLAGSIQHYKSAFLDAWRDKDAAGPLCSGRVQRWSASGCYWYLAAGLTLPMFGRDKALLRGVLVGIWNGYLLGRE